MDIKNFIVIFRRSCEDFAKIPSIIISGFAFFLLIYAVSYAGGKIALSLQSSSLNILWVVVSLLIIFLGGSFILGGLIGNSCIQQRKKQIKNFISHGRKYWLRNFAILVAFLLLYNILNGILFAFTLGMIYVSSLFVVSETVFKLIAFLISFVFLAGVVIFFTFSNVFVVVENLKFQDGLKKSVRFVKKEYFATLSAIMIFFVVFFVTDLIPGILGNIFKYAVVTPFFIVLLTKFVLAEKEN